MKNVQPCDVMVIGGDFNFRLNLNKDDAHRMLESGVDLRMHDQYLTTNGLGFDEFPVTFKPTYKLLKGFRRYDPTRGPAWCDRILWGRGQTTKARSYQSHDILLSDHLPVSICLEAPLLSETPFSVTKRGGEETPSPTRKNCKSTTNFRTRH